jgi:hypothetical protein
MQEVVMIICVIALIVFFFSPYDLKMDEDDV